MINVLVSGSKGQLGSEIRAISANFPDFSFTFIDIDELDLRNTKEVKKFFNEDGFDFCINCAAYTAVDLAEEESALANELNANAVAELAKACKTHNVYLIHISTDYVFDGKHHKPYRETHPTSPNSVYGESKLAGEEAIKKYAGKWMIIRTSWLYSSFGHNFVKTIMRIASEREDISVVDDQIGTPTFAGDLAKAILQIIGKVKNESGGDIYHFSNEGVASWYDFAVAIVEEAKLECAVHPIETRDFPTPAQRPAYSVLSKLKIKKDFEIKIPYWRDSLRVVILPDLKSFKNTAMTTEIDQDVLAKANEWLAGSYDQETKDAIKEMMENDPQELIESFYRDLEFGTGGLRGIMGVGSNRMNKYTVGAATQGFSNYLKKCFPDAAPLKVAIAYDPRNNSPFFSQISADVFSANGIKVYMFDDLRPTPELSFAIRHFGCQGGIVITASHNPKEYNGYKAYWDDGGQLISPHDTNVIDEVNKIKDAADVRFDGNRDLIEVIGEEFDRLYIEKIKSLSLSPDAIQRQKDFKIVYTPIHGTGVKLVPQALKAFGFEKVYGVDEQDIVDGNFPTVVSPNPEESAALEMAINKAIEIDADLVMATDPDADRVGIAIRKGEEFILLNGNQAASLLIYYLLNKWDENGKLTGNEYICKTIVTTELLNDIADKYHVEHYDVLTGFKFIADLIKSFEGEKTFIGGGEESYGYLVGDFVRDKDAVSSCAMIAETAAWAADQGIGLYDLLQDIYLEFGLYKEKLVSMVKKGKAGAEEIQKKMAEFRESPPVSLNGSKLVVIKDYLSSEEKDLISGEVKPITLPKSNVLQFFTEDGSKISVRPSGTEPKIKFYFGVKSDLDSKADFKRVNAELDRKVEGIIEDLGD